MIVVHYDFPGNGMSMRSVFNMNMKQLVRPFSRRFLRYYHDLLTSQSSWADKVVDQVFSQYGVYP